MADVKDGMGEQWRREILGDLSNLPFNASVPGTLLVYGERARPILRNPQKRSVWVAAGELGEGRVCVVAHTHYIAKFKSSGGHEHTEMAKFHQNIKLWLTKFTGVENSNIHMLKDLTVETLGSARIIICTSDNNPNIPDELIRQFVECGGALLHSICPWGWLQAKSHHSLQDVPLYSIMEEVGITYTDGYFHCPQSGMEIGLCAATESYHMLHALENMHLDNSCQTLSQISQVPIKTLHGMVAKSGHVFKNAVDEKGHEGIPSEHNPISTSKAKSMMYVHDVLAKTGNGPPKMPGVSHFPGDFDVDPPTAKAEIVIDSSIDACHPTGYYARAGEEITIEVLSDDSINQGWEILIGAHTDKLHTSTPMKRWPIISEKFKITAREMTLRTPFGGLFYVWSPNKESHMALHVNNIIEAPIFDLMRPETIDNWHESRMAPGLWADICGKHIVLTLPASSVRNVEDPTAALETLDRLVCAHHHLRGTDPNASRREWVVTDIQPTGGYMHSGYPIVTHLDVAQPENAAFLLKNEHLLGKGNWGLFHELGHNMQRPAWTFKGTGEVTCNIFTLHAMEVISNRQIWIHPWLKNQVKRAHQYIKDSSEFSQWQADPGLALFVYAQIIHQFGWSVYKKAFRHYEDRNRSLRLITDSDKIEFWFQTMSQFAEHNLAPLADLWNIPLSSACKQELNNFPPFLPDDEITQGVPEKVESLMGMYPGIVTNVNKPHDAFEQKECSPHKWCVMVNRL